MGTITTMSDTVAVTVIRQDEPDEEETWALVADPYTAVAVSDPVVEAHPDPYAADCIVILTAL